MYVFWTAALTPTASDRPFKVAAVGFEINSVDSKQAMGELRVKSSKIANIHKLNQIDMSFMGSDTCDELPELLHWHNWLYSMFPDPVANPQSQTEGVVFLLD